MLMSHRNRLRITGSEKTYIVLNAITDRVKSLDTKQVRKIYGDSEDAPIDVDYEVRRYGCIKEDGFRFVSSMTAEQYAVLAKCD